MPGEVVWWLGKPGGRAESVHRLRKLMVGAMCWLLVQLTMVQRESVQTAMELRESVQTC